MTDAYLPVRVARDRIKANDWSLVLSAADIEHDVRPVGHNWLVVVAEDDLEAALTSLDAYDQEQRLADIAPPAAIEYGPTRAALWYMAALVLFYFSIEYALDAYAWEEAGRAYSVRIRSGEWWRAITALTLHASVMHVLSNAVAGAVFGTALCRVVGPGTALWILLLAGGGGNLLNAYLRGATHAAIGASTAVFAGFGALAGLQTVRRYRFVRERRRAWVPFAAALAMLAMLGVGEDTDIWAHLLGLLTGYAGGIIAAQVQRKPPDKQIERGLVAAGVVAIGVCWALALL